MQKSVFETKVLCSLFCVCVCGGIGGVLTFLSYKKTHNQQTVLSVLVVSALRDHQISRRYFFFELDGAGTQSSSLISLVEPALGSL